MSGSGKTDLKKGWITAVLGIFVAGIVMGVIMRTRSNDIAKNGNPDSQSRKTSQYKQTRLIDGYDWNELGELGIPVSDRVDIKTSLLKVSLESAIVNGSDIITPQGPLRGYVQYIDTFYRDSGNIDIPVFFAMKMADMAKKGSPETIIRAYNRVVKQKLEGAGLID